MRWELRGAAIFEESLIGAKRPTQSRFLVGITQIMNRRGEEQTGLYEKDLILAPSLSQEKGRRTESPFQSPDNSPGSGLLGRSTGA
jgi:hypothetical protein